MEKIEIQKKGSSGSVVFQKENVVEKRGPASKILPEIWAYQRLQSLLGEGDKTFPRILDVYEDQQGEVIALILERLKGDYDLEEYILATADEDERLGHITTVIRSTLNRLNNWQQLFSSVSEDPHLLLREILEGIEFLQGKFGEKEQCFNLAELYQLLSEDRTKSFLLEGVVLGPCHRDLGTNNIWPLFDGNVRFFDPHWQLTGSSTTSRGHVVLDLTSLRVNLERLQAARRRRGLAKSLPLKLIDDYLRVMIREKRFREEIYLLALLRRYLSFVACRCDFCLAPQRRFLFDLMKRRSVATYHQLIRRVKEI